MSNKRKWTEQDMPDMIGKVAIVTGANTGIGYEAARALAQKGATVILACRNLDKANAAAEQIKATRPSGTPVVMQLDLGDLESVREFVAAFRADYQQLDLLINNAGVMMPPYSKTPQGFELQFGVNHMGHFALTGLLLDLILQSPGSRIVTVSSSGHRYGRMNFDDLNSENDYSPMRAYAQSKLANLLFTYELQRKLKAAGHSTLATACHPGWTRTDLQRHTLFFRIMNPLVSQRPPMGALPTLYAAMADDIEGGEYVGPRRLGGLRGYPKIASSSDRSHDKEAATRLWKVSEDMTGVVYEFGA